MSYLCLSLPNQVPVVLDDETIPVPTPSPVLVEPTPTPEILPYHAIPKEMRSEMRWSVWRREPDGKRKIPYSCSAWRSVVNV